MTRYLSVAFFVPLSFIAFGCSTATTRTQPQVPHEHTIVNTVRPGNAHGNSLVLPEAFRGFEPEAPRSALASNGASTTSSDWVDRSMPFSSQYDDDTSSQWAVNSPTATAEQVLGIETDASAAELGTDEVSESSSAEPSRSSSPLDENVEVFLPAAPATYHDTSSSWSDYEESAPEPEEVSRATTEQVYQAVSELPGLDTWRVVPIAHFRSGLRHVVVAWPAINASGQVADATVVGVCLDEDGEGRLEQCGQRWVISDRTASSAALEAALGGDYEIVSDQSSETLDQLGPRLERLGNDFVNAITRDDVAEAQTKARAFAAMLPASQVAFDNSLAQLLWMAAQYEGRVDHVSTENHGATATLTFDVSRGWMRVRTIRVIAQPVASRPGHWSIVDYR